VPWRRAAEAQNRARGAAGVMHLGADDATRHCDRVVLTVAVMHFFDRIVWAW